MSVANKINKYGMPVVIALSVTLGMFVQQRISKKNQYQQNVGTQNTNKLNAVLDYVERQYVDTVNIDKVIEDIVPDVLKQLDPHSVYIPASELQATNEPLEGNFDGIGVQFNIQKDTVIVVKVINGGPSEKVGIHDGDRIITVNDTVIAGININNDKVMSLLRGKKGTKVEVGIARKNEPELIKFSITRDAIPLYSIDVSYMVTPTIGYIKLTKFAKTTYKEFQQAIAMLKASGMTKLIFDLRGNSGGYMDAAINIADEFLDNGKLIVYTQGRVRPRTSYYATSRTSCSDIKLAVLIDEWSASASEIVAGAIQDNDRGIIIGRRSFGKGLVQEPVMFADGSAMRLTIARYYTPAGRCIQKPYINGSDEDYFTDLENRYLNGEFTEKDSIHLDDTVKYFTTSGRVVYGGGGIMPDNFIPFDTTGGSKYLNIISRKGLEYQFCFEYADANRKKLAQFTDANSINNYLENQDILGQFVKFAQKNGVKPDAKDIKTSGKIINTQVKALIARNILDNNGFYPIIHQIDNTFTETVKLIENK